MKKLTTLLILCLLLVNKGFCSNGQPSPNAEKIDGNLEKLRSFRGQGQLNRDSLKHYSELILEKYREELNQDQFIETMASQLISLYHAPFADYALNAEELISFLKVNKRFKEEINERYYLALKAHTAGDTSADSLYEIALQRLETVKESLDKSYCKLKVRLTTSLASHYDYNGLYFDATDKLITALKLAESCGDSSVLLHAYKSAGAILAKMSKVRSYPLYKWSHKDGEIKEYLIKAYQLAKALDNKQVYALAAYNLAYYYYEQNSLDQAKKLISESMSLEDMPWMPRQNYYNNMLLFDIAIKEKNTKDASQYIDSALVAVEKLNEPRIRFMSQLDLAEWQLVSGNPEAALNRLIKLENEKSQTHNLELMSELYKLKAKAYESSDQYKRAHFAFKEHIQIKDTLNQQTRYDQLAALLARYDQAKLESELATLKNIKLKDKIFFERMLLGALLVITVLTAWILWRYARVKTRQAELEKTIIDTEQKLFRSMMNPHFIFNTLGSIQCFLLHDKQQEKAAYYLTKFAKLML
jgi:hypothetical protein